MSYKDLTIPLLSDIVKSDPNNVVNKDYIARLFYNEGGKSKGIIVNFYGSSTTHTIFPEDHIVPQTILARGYAFLQVIPIAVSSMPLNTAVYVYNASDPNIIYAHEVQSVLNYIIDTIIVDPTMQEMFDSTTKTFVTATSRGAIGFLQWSSNRDKGVFKYGDKVKTFYINAPISGGANEGYWYDAMNVGRTLLGNLQNTKHEGVVTFGKDDRTHSNRSIIERVRFALTNNLVKLVIPSDARFNHTYPQTYPDLFYNAAMDWFDQY